MGVGTIHSIYAKVLNIQHGNTLFSLQSGHSAKTPLSLLLNQECNFFDLKLKEGDKAQFYHGKLQINNHSFLYTKAETWNSKLCSKADIQINPSSLKTILIAAEFFGKKSGLGNLAKYFNSKLLKNEYSLQFNEIEKEILRRVNPIINKDCFSEQDLARNLLALIGLGIGLTPSGDDLLVGFLSVLYLFNSKGTFTDFNSLLKSEILNAENKTTKISHEFLIAACDGYFGELIHLFFDALLFNQEKLMQATVCLLKKGSSSGTDTLCGILFGLFYIKRQTA